MLTHECLRGNKKVDIFGEKMGFLKNHEFTFFFFIYISKEKLSIHA